MTTQDPVLDEVVDKLRRMQFNNHPESRSLGVGKPELLEDEEEAKDWRRDADCVCQRPLKLVMCGVCGETFPARLKRDCAVHPR